MVSNVFAQQKLQYSFKGSLQEDSLMGPALIQVGSNSFETNVLTEIGCQPRTVYRHSFNSGFYFDNAAASNFIDRHYSIEMYFNHLSTGPIYRRVLDYKSQTTDFGLYVKENEIMFYNRANSAVVAFSPGEYDQVVVTRDSSDDRYRMYVNGMYAGQFRDTTDMAIIDTSGLLRFFIDDLVNPNEASEGRIALLRLYNYRLTANEIETNFNNLSEIIPSLNITTTPTAQCLEQNNFFFTHNGVDTTAQFNYSWQFGDGDSSNNVFASHTYAAVGSYSVQLVQSTLNCSDTVNGTFLVYNAPNFSLGDDTLLCSNTFTIDAGVWSSYLWSDGSTDQTLFVISGGNYAVQVSDSNGCLLSDTIQISIGTTPTIELGNDTAVCTEINLDAGSGYAQYVWSNGSTDQTVSITQSGNVYVQIFDSMGCSNTDTINITVNGLPSTGLSSQLLICDVDTISLDAGTGFVSYLWNDGSTNQSLIVFNDGQYTIEVSDTNSCSNTDTVQVTFGNIPSVSLGNDTTICGGYTLNAGSGFATYLWSDGSSNSTLFTNISGTYAVLISDSMGCENSDTLEVTITPGTLVDLGPDSSYCSASAIILNAGAGFVSYVWQDSSSAATFSAVSSGMYYVAVIDTNGCNSSDTININIFTPPTVDLGPTDTSACAFYTLDAGAGFNYLWSNGSTTQAIDITGSGEFTITVTDTNGCSASDVIYVTILALPNVNLGNDTSLCDGAILILNAGNGYVSYNWNTGSSGQSISPINSGLYYVNVVDSNACENSDSIQVSFIVLSAPTITQSGDTLFSSSASGNQWYDMAGPIVGATNNYYIPSVQNGTFYVAYTDSNNCTSPLSTGFVFVGLQELLGSGISVYPNPVQNDLYINAINSISAIEQIQIVDLNGKVVFTKVNVENELMVVDLQKLNAGTYFLRIQTKETNLIHSFTIVR